MSIKICQAQTLIVSSFTMRAQVDEDRMRIANAAVEISSMITKYDVPGIRRPFTALSIPYYLSFLL